MKGQRKRNSVMVGILFVLLLTGLLAGLKISLLQLPFFKHQEHGFSLIKEEREPGPAEEQGKPEKPERLERSEGIPEKTEDFSGTWQGTGIKQISVAWVSGEVQVRTVADAKEINVTETGAQKAGEAMWIQVENDKLKIHWNDDKEMLKGIFKGKNLFEKGRRKELLIEIPEDLAFESIECETVSADVLLTAVHVKELAVRSSSGEVQGKKLQGEKLTISSTSGNLHLAEVTGEEMELDTTSGEIQGEDMTVKKMDFETVSGNVYLMGEILKKIDGETVSGEMAITLSGESFPREMDLETISGDLRLKIPEDAGFDLEFDSLSGDLSVFDQEMGRTERWHVEGRDPMEIQGKTVSGDLFIEGLSE